MGGRGVSRWRGGVLRSEAGSFSGDRAAAVGRSPPELGADFATISTQA